MNRKIILLSTMLVCGIISCMNKIVLEKVSKPSKNILIDFVDYGTNLYKGPNAIGLYSCFRIKEFLEKKRFKDLLNDPKDNENGPVESIFSYLDIGDISVSKGEQLSNLFEILKLISPRNKSLLFPNMVSYQKENFENFSFDKIDKIFPKGIGEVNKISNRLITFLFENSHWIRMSKLDDWNPYRLYISNKHYLSFEICKKDLFEKLYRYHFNYLNNDYIFTDEFKNKNKLIDLETFLSKFKKISDIEEYNKTHDESCNIDIDLIGKNFVKFDNPIKSGELYINYNEDIGYFKPLSNGDKYNFYLLDKNSSSFLFVLLKNNKFYCAKTQRSEEKNNKRINLRELSI